MATTLDRLKEADATVDVVVLPDGTSRLLITLPFGVRDPQGEDEAA